jgi:PIN domain nuclease of toxin-antitoxin system
VRLLLDTHVFLWMHGAPDRLGVHRQSVETDDNELLLSAVSAWEIAIKYELGKLPLPEPPESYVPERMRRGAVRSLGVDQSHVLATARLPRLHRDPFDRLLVAQAQLLGLTILTADPMVARYPVDTLLA